MILKPGGGAAEGTLTASIFASSRFGKDVVAGTKKPKAEAAPFPPISLPPLQRQATKAIETAQAKYGPGIIAFGRGTNGDKPAEPRGVILPEITYGGREVPGFQFAPTGSGRAVAEVDLGAIHHNVKEIQRMAADTNCRLCGIIKADAYGHGAVTVAHMLSRCNGIDFFGVATLDEAIELRESGLPLEVRVLVLGASMPFEWDWYTKYKLDVMVQSGEAAAALIEWSEKRHKQGRLIHPMRAHIMLNTGMSRIGLTTFNASEINENTDLVKRGSAGNSQTYHGLEAEGAAQVVAMMDAVDDRALEFVALCTHMSDAKKGSSYTIQQFERVARVCAAVRRLGIRIPMIHLENSESLLADCISDDDFKALLQGNPNGLPDTVGYARSGGGMYGQRNHSFLKPAMSLKAQVRHVHVAEKGVPVGYDRSWCAPEDCQIATLAIGFADGYNRANSNAGAYGVKNKIGVDGTMCEIAGKVCMDMMMVNCGPPGAVKVKPGDYAVLYGPGGPSLKEVAGKLGTAQSDVTCDLMRRVQRSYVNCPVAPKHSLLPDDNYIGNDALMRRK